MSNTFSLNIASSSLNITAECSYRRMHNKDFFY